MNFRFDAARTLRGGALAVAALLLIPSTALAGSSTRPPLQTAVLAGGCFWGMEDVFEKLNGVSTVVAGYSGGSADTATYEIVSEGNSGHAESVKITFDPARISYKTLLEVYFRVAADPTQRDRQGPDDGTQYRSAIFYANDGQRRTARAEIAELSQAKAYANPIVTELVPLKGFYPAEAYHQHFADRNPNYPYIVAIDAPKVNALRSKFPQLLKDTN